MWEPISESWNPKAMITEMRWPMIVTTGQNKNSVGQ